MDSSASRPVASVDPVCARFAPELCKPLDVGNCACRTPTTRGLLTFAQESGSVTLVFYEIGKGMDILKEPFLNIVAAAAQMSSFTHVEIAIGSEAGSFGQMCNVCRIFNDDVGVELTSRTGRNPQYSYLSLGCSKRAELAMLAHARSLVGRPFSSVGMARSMFYPRSTDESSFFCAELVACILQRGGLMCATAQTRLAHAQYLAGARGVAYYARRRDFRDIFVHRSQRSNPGAETPRSLHTLFKNRAAATANPYTLRQFAAASSIGVCDPPRSSNALGFSGLLDTNVGAGAARTTTGYDAGRRRRGDSPPRMSFKCIR